MCNSEDESVCHYILQSGIDSDIWVLGTEMRKQQKYVWGSELWLPFDLESRIKSALSPEVIPVQISTVLRWVKKKKKNQIISLGFGLLKMYNINYDIKKYYFQAWQSLFY